MIAGSRGSASIFRLSRLICTSMLRSNAALDRPLARSSNWSRVSTRWGLATKAMSRSNSPLVMSTIAPRRRAQDAACRLQAPSIEFIGKRQIVPVRRDLGRAAQNSLDPRDQLARTEGLHDIIVGANLEADDAVDLRAHGGQHDDRRPVLLAQLLAEDEPALAGHHEVEHDEVETADLDRLHHLAPVGRLGDPEAVLAKVLAHERAKLAIVIDNQNVTGGACAQEIRSKPNKFRPQLSDAQ